MTSHPMHSLPLRLVPGDDLRSTLEAHARRTFPDGAFVVCGIGSLGDVRLRHAGADEAVRLAGVHEILTLSGYGAAKPGDPRSTGTYRSVGLPVIEPYGPSRVLVWLKGTGGGACQGDSGGPIAGPDGAVLALSAWIGGACGGLTQAVRVAPQRDWLDRTLAGWDRTARWH